MKELTKAFRRRHREEQAAGSSRHDTRANLIWEFIEKGEELLAQDWVGQGTSLISTQVEENFELLVTYLDLSINHKVEIRIQELERTASAEGGLPVPGIPRWPTRTAIETFLYLSLIDGRDIKRDILRDFIGLLVPGDSIITFNYDLVLDRALFEASLWNPKDGYGIVVDILRDVAPAMDYDSAIRLLKLHGSLNWLLQGPVNRSFGNPIDLYWWRHDGEPHFPGYLADSAPPAGRRPPGHSGYGILPSFIKTIENPGLLEIWRRAVQALRTAERVVAIGYSLPKADSAACTLFATAGLDMGGRRIAIVDPDCRSLSDHYRTITGHPAPDGFACIQEFLEGYADRSSRNGST